jgi:hypothetical protein
MQAQTRITRAGSGGGIGSFTLCRCRRRRRGDRRGPSRRAAAAVPRRLISRPRPPGEAWAGEGRPDRSGESVGRSTRLRRPVGGSIRTGGAGGGVESSGEEAVPVVVVVDLVDDGSGKEGRRVAGREAWSWAGSPWRGRRWRRTSRCRLPSLGPHLWIQPNKPPHHKSSDARYPSSFSYANDPILFIVIRSESKKTPRTNNNKILFLRDV